MLSKKMNEALNDQINKELFSSYLYYSMASWLEDQNLPGFASWMVVQAQEEISHAHKLYIYVNDRHGRATMKAIGQPETEWKSPVEVFQAAFDHEVMITKSINNLVDIAMEEKDHSTHQMLQWFVEEQVEEEAAADTVLQDLKRIEDSRGGVFMLDREMGQRAFTYPPPALTE